MLAKKLPPTNNTSLCSGNLSIYQLKPPGVVGVAKRHTDEGNAKAKPPQKTLLFPRLGL